ncbi:MAG: FCD domain-containing protein [Clostridia bacterium]
MEKGVVDSIFDGMISCIVCREWVAGHRIPTENELAIKFHASRNSVRQAIARLKALDLIETKKGSGTVLKKHSVSSTLSDFVPTIMFETEDNLQIFEFHKGIQIECVKLACFRHTDAQLDSLISEFQQMKECYASGDMQNAIVHDLQFHKVICEMSDNIMFVKATELIFQHLEQSFLQICTSFDYTDSIFFHGRMIDAIKANNQVFAATVMEAHQWDTYQKHLLILQR